LFNVGTMCVPKRPLAATGCPPLQCNRPLGDSMASRGLPQEVRSGNLTASSRLTQWVDEPVRHQRFLLSAAADDPCRRNPCVSRAALYHAPDDNGRNVSLNCLLLWRPCRKPQNPQTRRTINDLDKEEVQISSAAAGPVSPAASPIETCKAAGRSNYRGWMTDRGNELPCKEEFRRNRECAASIRACLLHAGSRLRVDHLDRPPLTGAQSSRRRVSDNPPRRRGELRVG
jgi:hypothetical protein